MHPLVSSCSRAGVWRVAGKTCARARVPMAQCEGRVVRPRARRGFEACELRAELRLTTTRAVDCALAARREWWCDCADMRARLLIRSSCIMARRTSAPSMAHLSACGVGGQRAQSLTGFGYGAHHSGQCSPSNVRGARSLEEHDATDPSHITQHRTVLLLHNAALRPATTAPLLPRGVPPYKSSPCTHLSFTARPQTQRQNTCVDGSDASRRSSHPAMGGATHSRIIHPSTGKKRARNMQPSL